MGYPGNKLGMTSNVLAEYIKVHSVNVGDPFKDGVGKSSALWHYEKEVILYLAELWNMKEDPWGYLTSSSSEALMFAMHNARNYFKKIDCNEEPILIFSSRIHYSISSNA